MKRIISLFLCITLLISVISVSAININAETTVNGGIQIGDTITLGKYLNEPIVWRCVDIDENGPLMLSEKVLCTKEYDAPGDSPYHDDGWGWVRKRWGSNCWQDSNIRQWLNSTEENVSWTHCPPSYASESGFMSNFSDYERSLIKSVTRVVNVNIWESVREGYCDGGIGDRISLPDINLNAESYYYKRIDDSMFLLNTIQYNNICKKNKNYLCSSIVCMSSIPEGNGYACFELLRAISPSGDIQTCSAWNEMGVRPAFYLNTDGIGDSVIREDGFNFFMNRSSNYIDVGSTAELHVGYFLNNKITYNASRRYIYTLSNSGVISIADNGWSNRYGQKLSITAKREGMSTITVTDPVSGESAALDIYVSPKESAWTFYNIPQIEKESGKITNFYNFSGMVIDDFSYEEHKDSSGIVDYYNVKMNIYNTNNLYGAVTSYYADGRICGYHVIDRKNDFEKSFVDSCKQLYYSIGDRYTHGDLYYLILNKSYYSGKSISKLTEVNEIEVPVGGYLSISNNIDISPVVAVANYSGLIIESVVLMKSLLNLKDNEAWFEKVEATVINEAIDDLINKNLEKSFTKSAQIAVKNINVNDNNFIARLYEVGVKLTANLGENFAEQIEKRFFEVSGLASMGESIFKKVLPTGWIIDSLYTLNEGFDFTLFLNQYIRSVDRPSGIDIYAPKTSSIFESNGVRIDAGETSDDTVIHAYTIADMSAAGIDSSTFKNEASYYGDKYKTYNITLYKNGAESQPESTVTVQIPVPNNFRGMSTRVYRNNEDGTITDMNARFVDGYMIFETNHFSYYSIVDESAPEFSADLHFSGASLTLYNDLEVNYKVPNSIIDSGYDNLYVKFELNGEDNVVKDYRIVDDMLVFDYSDIMPNQMCDTIKATLYAEHDDTLYYGETREYSVAEYCYNMLNKYQSDEYSKLRTLIVDLLNYGTEAQLYTDYRTESLANSSLTPEQAAFGTKESPAFQTVQDSEYKVIDAPEVTWKGAGLNLQTAVTMRFKIATEEIDGLTVRVQNAYDEWIIGAESFEATNGGYYVFFDGLNAGQMSEPVYVTVYNGSTAVSNTICYSIESYAYSKQNSGDTLLNSLLIAMMKYGNSAYSYVN